jgi:transketolase
LVSMPCVEWFDEQDEAYRASVLPREVTARVVVEAGIRQCWDRFLGENGRFVGMHSFGASAPYAALYKHFGITPEHVIEEAKASLAAK